MARTRDPATTTAKLLAAARHEFARHGYFNAKTETIVHAAGVTRGALYHHFRDKAAVFEAVVEQMQAEIAIEVTRAASRARSPLAAFRAGCDAYLDCCTRADVRRIVLCDGPSVLGWDRWRELDERHAYRATLQAVTACIAAGEIVVVEPEPMTRVLLAMITQVGLDIGRTAHPLRDRRRLGDAVSVVLQRLQT